MTCLTVIGGENIWKERAIASGFCETADGSVPKSKVNSFLRDFLKFVCANSLYCGGPKTLLTDQHLLRTNLFFVTETSELRLAGLMSIRLSKSTECCCYFQSFKTVPTIIQSRLSTARPVITLISYKAVAGVSRFFGH